MDSEIRGAGGPSLRLKSGCAQDDTIGIEFEFINA